jgi:hypothetical protein
MVIFSTFPCTVFDGDYGAFLTVDKSIDCSSSSHTSMLGYATAMIFVFPVGKPLLCLFLLWRKKDKIDVGQKRLEAELGDDVAAMKAALDERDGDEEIKHLTFLFENYQPKYDERTSILPCKLY